MPQPTPDPVATDSLLRGLPVLEDLEALLRRHKGKMAVTFAVIMTLVTGWTIVCPRTYRAEGKLLLRLGRENVTLDPTVMSGGEPVLAIPQSRENELNSAAEVLRSRVLLDKVVDTIGPQAILGQGVPAAGSTSSATEAAVVSTDWTDRLRGAVLGTSSPHDRAISRVSKDLDVGRVPKTDIVSVAYQASTPELAQRVTAMLIDFYLQEHIRVNHSQGAYPFLAEETGRLRADLTKSEERLRDLKNQMGLASGESQQQLLVVRIGRLEDDRLRAESDLAVSQARVRKLEETLAQLPQTEVLEQMSGFTNEGTDNMRGQYYALQVRVQELAAKYHDNHPLLQEAQRQLAEAGRALGHEQSTRDHVTTGRSKAYEQAEVALVVEKPILSALEAQATVLRRQLADSREEQKQLNERDRQLTALQREIQLLEANYRRSASNLEQARIDQQLENQRISNISVAQPATADPKPVSPRPMQNLALGLALAVCASLGLALAVDRRDRVAGSEQQDASLLLTSVARLPAGVTNQDGAQCPVSDGGTHGSSDGVARS